VKFKGNENSLFFVFNINMDSDDESLPPNCAGSTNCQLPASHSTNPAQLGEQQINQHLYEHITALTNTQG